MERIGAEVERTLGRAGDGAALALSRITAVWLQAVGEAVARNAWPLRLGRDGTLHVATSSATWAFELDRLSPDIATSLQEMLGEVTPPRFRFRPGPIPEPGAVSGGRQDSQAPPPEVSPEAASAADLAAAEIEDPELRELIARAARASLGRGGSGRTF